MKFWIPLFCCLICFTTNPVPAKPLQERKARLEGVLGEVRAGCEVRSLQDRSDRGGGSGRGNRNEKAHTTKGI
jgi:hypothetical protein